MIGTALQTDLEFLILFFSMPDESFYKRVYSGDAPIGKLEFNGSQKEFCETMAVEATGLFVNSKEKITIHPLMTAFMTGEDEKIEAINMITSEYDKYGLTVRAFPPDHLKVMYEFILHRIISDDIKDASGFFNGYIKGWTDTMANHIIERKPSLFFERIAELMKAVNTQMEKLGAES